MDTIFILPALFFVILGLAAALAVGYLVVHVLVKSRRTRQVAGVIIGLAFVLVASFGAYLFVMDKQASLTGNELLNMPVMHETPYQPAWLQPPKEGTFPAWLKTAALFAPDLHHNATQLADFQYVLPDDQHALAGYSDFENSPGEAEAQAWTCVLNRIKLLLLVDLNDAVLNRTRTHATARQIRRIKWLLDQAITRKAITARKAEITLDGYADAVTVGASIGGRPVGTVYRAACRVVLSPQTQQTMQRNLMDNVMDMLEREKQDKEKNLRNWGYTAMVALFMFFVILSIYIFLNAHTKGYFAWPLRIMAALLYGASVGGFWFFLRVFM